MDGNFDKQSVTIKYICHTAGSDANAENPLSYHFSNRPHALNIKWQENLKLSVTATDKYGNTKHCEENIPKTPGKTKFSDLYFNITLFTFLLLEFAV